ncbi:VIR-like CYIR protein [Plasmodium cynomolgi strain B]|uniref:VIR-like CYIR protein n=1 Tax=Plasmodium cynomolgi (strain B) TaxID=1120755 RepID=K6V8Y1_PLACD|nr:VIR-like CYIR protein [Plasmodium cynomolgi strain B]GAB65597.1 VIR-like CYIR protein [Plasmodium cynomolgi strain B]
MKEIFGFSLIKILTFSALIWISPNSYGSANLGESWENRININNKLDVRNSRLLNARYEKNRHERNVNLKEGKHNMLKDEDHYERRSPNKMKNKPNTREQMQDLRFRDRHDKSQSKTKHGDHSGRRNDKLSNEKIDRRSKDNADRDQDDSFLKEPEDGYYRREENVQYGEGRTEFKKPPNNNVTEIQKKPEVNNKNLENLPPPPNGKAPQMVEYYEYSKTKKGLKEKLVNILNKMDVQFQLEFIRYIKGKKHVTEREFLVLRGKREKIAYYFKRYKIFLPLIVQTTIFLIFLLLALTSNSAPIAMTIMAFITGELLLNLLYYYLKEYIKIRKIHKTFKKHGVIIKK